MCEWWECGWGSVGERGRGGVKRGEWEEVRGERKEGDDEKTVRWGGLTIIFITSPHAKKDLQ